ncbi:hypothetical protein L1S32_01085 [Methanogenium sp. S4BF]|uniref:HVO_0476 family zinc finger protein n=1 Tax=Methanogenium sp. S4BF TaxID=1789226 RepID=UPI00241664B1|nr:HVO_0476 family zinc finger protein [Methanogenium sp. S4BF]WFN34748.1 hypothetical protein L1S32_01085 [Methanogenium sp. S4BF]
MMYEVHCPICGEETTHRILKESSDLLVQCEVCSHVHRVLRPPCPEPVVVRAIISDEDSSQVGTIELNESDKCFIGDFFVAEIGEEVYTVEVCGIEVGQRRPSRARATDITALWTRVIDSVVVKISVHDGMRTIPCYLRCDGERDFQIGGIENIDGMNVRISHIKLRNGSMMRKEGWKAYARKIRRVYGTRL